MDEATQKLLREISHRKGILELRVQIKRLEALESRLHALELQRRGEAVRYV